MYRFHRSYALNFMYGLISGFFISWWSLPLLITPNSKEIGINRNEFILDSEENPGQVTFSDAIDVDHDDPKIVRKQKMFQHMHEDTDISKIIKKNVRIHCWIMVGKNDTRAFLVNQTWIHHCNKHIFITSSPESGLPTVDLNLTEGRNMLWAKTKAAFKWIYYNELNDYDWFLKADTDSFIFLENLRFMLLAYSRYDPVYFGCKFRPYTKQGYMSGGAGYVLSREALRKFVEEALPDPKKCRQDGNGPEDVEMGRCLENVGVIAGDSRDSTGKHRMLPFDPATHLQAGPNNASWIPYWFLKYLYYPYKQGEECCSDYMISFHYVWDGDMLLLYDLVYHVRAFAFTGDIASELRKNSGGGKSLLEAAKDLAISLSVPFESMVAESKNLISNSSITYESAPRGPTKADFSTTSLPSNSSIGSAKDQESQKGRTLESSRRSSRSRSITRPIIQPTVSKSSRADRETHPTELQTSRPNSSSRNTPTSQSSRSRVSSNKTPNRSTKRSNRSTPTSQPSRVGH